MKWKTYLEIVRALLDKDNLRLDELSIVQKGLLDVNLKPEVELTKKDFLHFHYDLLNCTPSIKVTQFIKYS